MRPAPITLDRFILEEQQASPRATGELSLLLMRFGVAGKRIAAALARAGLTGDARLGGLGQRPGGRAEEAGRPRQRHPARDVRLRRPRDPGRLGGDGGAVRLRRQSRAREIRRGLRPDGRLLEHRRQRHAGNDLLDPPARRRRTLGPPALRRTTRWRPATSSSATASSSCTRRATACTCSRWTPRSESSCCARHSVRMPDRGRAYAVNEGRSHGWAPEVRAFVDHLKDPGEDGRPALRDALLGVPRGRRSPVPPRGRHLPVSRRRDAGRQEPGKLRVLYECHPLALVVEQAGGRASTGTQRVLDVVPASLHARMPLAIGSRVGGRALREVPAGGAMRLRSCGAAVLLTAIALPAPAQGRVSSGPEDPQEKDKEKVDRPIPYATPAREMQKLGFLLGRWTAKETWEEPLRYKRPGYEGYPGSSGYLRGPWRRGPAASPFSGPRRAAARWAGYTSRATLAWTRPAGLRADRVHSLFPGIVRLTRIRERQAGAAGEDRWTGEAPLRLTSTRSTSPARRVHRRLPAAESRREARRRDRRFEMLSIRGEGRGGGGGEEEGGGEEGGGRGRGGRRGEERGGGGERRRGGGGGEGGGGRGGDRGAQASPLGGGGGGGGGGEGVGEVMRGIEGGWEVWGWEG